MLDYKKTIENLTREQKIAMLSNASVSLDGVDPVTFVSFDGANEEIGRFPSLRAVTRSWDRELACFVAGGIAEQAKQRAKTHLFWTRISRFAIRIAKDCRKIRILPVEWAVLSRRELKT